VWLSCPWWEAVMEVPLHFSPPMIASWRLLTSNTRKFVHVTVKSTVAHLIQFQLIDPKLECDSNTTLSDLNPKDAGNMVVASDGTTASFMWELLKDPLVNETEHTSLMYEVLADQTMWAVLGRTAGVISMEAASGPQQVSLDVMPLVAGYLPLPTVRLSKYIAANTKDPKKDISAHPRLEPFSPGQVYHAGKATQVHVLPPAPKDHDTAS
ncbi:Trafficking protein particle complex subunit 10, partial [Papilio machaon]